MRSSDWLEAAADLVEEHGWVRDEYMTRDGRLCVMTALWGVAEDVRTRTGVRLDHSEAATFVVAELGIELDECSETELQKALIGWNDNKAQDATHVIDVLRWAAKRAREADPECGPQT